MRVLDLFSGIGGFALGLESVGFTTVGFCEIEPFPRAVLAKHWPSVPIHDDVRTLSAESVPWLRAEAARGIDLICGGFPCQDISVAGKGAGLAGARSGLWSECSRLVGELRPRWALFENVGALKQRGIDRVCSDLEGEGYAVWPLLVGAGVGVGAPHRRDRVWIVARRMDDANGGGRGHDIPSAAKSGSDGQDDGVSGTSGAVAHRNDDGRNRDGSLRLPRGVGGVERSHEGEEPEARRTSAQPTRDGALGASELSNSDAGRRGRKDDQVQAGRDEPERPDSAVGLADGYRRRCKSSGLAYWDATSDEYGEPRWYVIDGRCERPVGDTAHLGVEGLRACGEQEPYPHGGPALSLRSGGICWPARPGEPQHEWEEPRLAYAASGAGGRTGQPREGTDQGRPEQPVGAATDGLPLDMVRLARRGNREALKAAGNSVVPQVVALIGRAILEADGGQR